MKQENVKKMNSDSEVVINITDETIISTNCCSFKDDTDKDKDEENKGNISKQCKITTKDDAKNL